MASHDDGGGPVSPNGQRIYFDDVTHDPVASLLIDKMENTPEWVDKGACVDADVDPFSRKDMKAMVALCAGCPVRKECDEYITSSGRDETITTVWHIAAARRIDQRGGTQGILLIDEDGNQIVQ